LSIRIVMPFTAQPPPEKCAEKACANEPKPPRLTPDELASKLPDDERPDALSLLKKLERDDDDPPQPCPPYQEDPRGPQLAMAGDVAGVATPGAAGAATPGTGGWQFSRGINA
jgi:hypothetical protein